MAVREPIGSRMTHYSWTARVAVGTIFFVNGLLVANWFARIPDVKQRLGLSEGTLGIVLLMSAVGALIAQPTAGWAIGRVGSRVVTTAMVCCSAGVVGVCWGKDGTSHEQVRSSRLMRKTAML